jgi:5'-nucleotidase / UDP-sugar diphosphatase
MTMQQLFKIILSTMIGCGLSACKTTDSSTHLAPLEINILHINDSHSHLDEVSTTLSIATSADQRENISLNYGGFARVVSLMQQRSEDLNNVIKIHAGDAIVGDLYYKLSQGRADALMMNSVCFDSFTLGNHEFDHGDAALKVFLQALAEQGACAKATAVLSSNVHFAADSALYAAELIRPYEIIEREGQKIALIGVTAAEKTKGSSRPDASTTFENERIAVQRSIDLLQAQGVNKIIVQSHIGYTEDLALAQQLKGVDVIIGGDSHSLLADSSIAKYGLNAVAEYPSMTQDASGQRVCIAQAWQYAALVGELKVQFDANGHVQSCAGRPHILVGQDYQRATGQPLSAEEVNNIQNELDHSQIFTRIEPDAATLARLAPFSREKIQFGQHQVAFASENLCLRRVPGRTRDVYRSVLGDRCNQNEFNHQYGGDIQQLVAEAFLQQGKRYFQADVALINAGGVREDIPTGVMNVDQIYRVLAFKNTLLKLKMSGDELKSMLEDAMTATLNGHTGSYPYTAGMRWQVDLNQPNGQRIRNIEVLAQDGQWQPLDATRSYNFITIDFLADGQGGYDTLKTIQGDRRLNVGLDYTEAFLQYLEDLPEQQGQRYVSRLNPSLYSTQGFVDRVD